MSPSALRFNWSYSVVAFACVACSGKGQANGVSVAEGGSAGTAATTSSSGARNASGGSGGSAIATGGATVSSGGSDASGGVSGAGGRAEIPHQVGQCDGLAAVGVWEEITPPGGDPGDFGLDPQNAGTVYVGSSMYHNGVWKTTDCGSSWQEASTGLNGDRIRAGRQTTFKIDPQHDWLYTNSLYGNNGVYRSSNAGVDWQDVTPSGQGMIDFVGHIDIDPDDPAHLLALFHAPCNGMNNEYTYNDGVGCFGETTDAGATWKAHYRTPSFPSEVMVFLLHGKTWIAAADGLQRTTDGGETWTKVADNGAGGHSTRPPYRASDGSYYAGTSAGILRSPGSSDGTSWTLIPNTGVYDLGATGDGKHVYVAGHQGIWTSPETDGLNWTLMPGSPSHTDGCAMDPRAFDQDHHLLYVSCFEGDGMWRMRTE